MDANNINDKDMRLGEDELKNISGGAFRCADASDTAKRIHLAASKDAAGSTSVTGSAGTQSHFCIKCNRDTVHNVFSGGRMVCSVCGTAPVL